MVMTTMMTTMTTTTTTRTTSVVVVVKIHMTEMKPSLNTVLSAVNVLETT